MPTQSGGKSCHTADGGLRLGGVPHLWRGGRDRRRREMRERERERRGRRLNKMISKVNFFALERA